MGQLLTWQEFTDGARPQGGSIPELLLDFIENVSPIDRPALALLRKVQVSGTYVEWQEDVLAARAHNAWVEGVDSTNPNLATPTRTFTHVQNFLKFGEVSDIQKFVDHKGFSDAYLYQEQKKVNELLNDVEHTLHRGSAATGATDAARQFPGFLKHPDRIGTDHLRTYGAVHNTAYLIQELQKILSLFGNKGRICGNTVYKAKVIGLLYFFYVRCIYEKLQNPSL